MAAAAAVVVLYILSVCVDIARAHVALTYPPARHYDLDFLDNSRTKGPCGMPKGECLLVSKLVWLFYVICIYGESGHACENVNMIYTG